MFENNRISTIVENQLPEFIRTDHPNFVALIKKYYEYLEQTNKTLQVNKNLYNYSDVDETRSDLIKYFKSKILPNFPEETELSTAKLVKAAKDFYSKKGTAESFKFLFRTLYNQEIDVYFPKEDILKASDGKWKLPQAIRLSFADTNEIVLGGNVNVATATANVVSANGFNIFSKGITANSYIRIGEEKRKVLSINTTGDYLTVEIPFAVQNAANSKIYETTKLYKVTLNQYENFNISLLERRQGIGENSRTTCIIERAVKTVDGETGREVVELYVSNVKRLFDAGENLVVEYDDENGIAKTFKSKIVSLISNISLYRNRLGVVQTGRKYKSGDPVVLYGGLADSPDAVKAIAVVNNVSTGSIESVTVTKPGYLFREDPNSLIRIISTSGVGANVIISGIRDDAPNSQTIFFNTDSIAYRNDILLDDPDGYDFDNITAQANQVITTINLTIGAGNTTTVVNLNTASYLASSTTDFYANSILKIVSGTGAASSPNSARITAYDGATKLATLNIALGSAVDGTSNVILFPNTNHKTIAVNLNSANYIANTTNDYYKSYIVRILSGAGSDGSGGKVNTAYIKTYYGSNTVAEINPLRAVRGTVNISSGSAVVTGNNFSNVNNMLDSNATAFLSDAIQGHYTYLVGKDITIDGETRNVVSVTNDYTLTVDSPFSTTNNNTKLYANAQLSVPPDGTSNILISVGIETEIDRAFAYEPILLGKVRALDLKDGGSFFEVPPTFDAISLHESDYSTDSQFLRIPSGQFYGYNPSGTPPSIKLNSSNNSFSLANGFYTGTRLFLDPGDTAHYAEVVDYIVTNPGTSANVKTVYLDRAFENNITVTNILNYALFFDFRPNVRGTGKIGTLLVKKGGTGYDSSDIVEFVGTGCNAAASLTVSSGVITDITLTDRGQGYPVPPTIRVMNATTGLVSTGTGAEFEIYLLSDGEEFTAETSDIGKIQDFRIINRGFEYANTPVTSLKVVDILTDNLAAGAIVLEGDSVWQGGATNAGASFTAIVDGAYRSDSTNTVIRVFNYSGGINTAEPLKVATGGGNLTLNISTSNATISFNDINEAVERKYPYFYGDGLAKANSEFLNGLIKYNGFYLNTDGFVSADKKIQNSDYYHNFSYEISSEKSLNDYKETMDRVAHPAGMQLLSKFLLKEVVEGKNKISSNIHLQNSDEWTTVNASFSTNVVYGTAGSGGSEFEINASAGDLIVINSSETATGKIYTRIIEQVISNSIIYVDSPIGGLGDGRFRLTTGCSNVVVYSNNSIVTESLEVNDNVTFNVGMTVYDRYVVAISGNTVTLNSTVSNTANVLYLKTPTYNIVNYKIITTDG